MPSIWFHLPHFIAMISFPSYLSSSLPLPLLPSPSSLPLLPLSPPSLLPSSPQCQHEDLLSQIEQLRRENTDLSEKLEEIIATNEKLRESNLLMQGRCETLLEDLSVKEAQWSKKEERLKMEASFFLLFLLDIPLICM